MRRGDTDSFQDNLLPYRKMVAVTKKWHSGNNANVCFCIELITHFSQNWLVN